MLCCPRSVSLCRMQLPEARYVPSLRRGLGAERPSWIRGHGRDLGAEGLRAPNPVSPRRSTHGQCDSGAGNPQQSSWAQGSMGSPAPHRPMESAGPGGKTACTAFLSQGELGVWFAARGEFPFAECSCQKLVLGRRCDWTSALCRRAGSRGMAGNCAHEAIVPLILLPNEGEPMGSECLPPETPSKAAGSREPGSAQPCFALWRAWGRGQKRLAVLPGSEAHWGCGLLPEECFPLQNAVPRSSFWAFGATGPRR